MNLKANAKPNERSSQKWEKDQLERASTVLEQKLQKAENQIIQLTKALEQEKSRSSVYRQDYEELKNRHQRFLHQHLRLLRKLHIHGIDASEFVEEPDPVL